VPTKLKILFLCTGNSCRSQMAEGFARRLLSRLEPYSAGVRPGGIDPRAVRAMAECGVDISHQRSKHVDELARVRFDRVVTVCASARESCPVFPGGARVDHVSFDDPPALARDARSEDEAMEHYRRVRDEIREFVSGLEATADDDTRGGKDER